jgi:hypothetical protein
MVKAVEGFKLSSRALEVRSLVTAFKKMHLPVSRLEISYVTMEYPMGIMEEVASCSYVFCVNG